MKRNVDIGLFTKSSIIVVAHLDDEALWFSSILNEVDKIVVCFLNFWREPNLGIGRKKSISEYPLKNIDCLEIDEIGTFECADWNNPVLSEYGIELLKTRLNEKYINNFYNLYQKLEKKLEGFDNVFTHNPWGDYGNEDHIQIYRVVKKLQKSLGFNLYFTNYCSNRSYALMTRIVYDHNFEYVTKETNKKLGEKIKNILMKNDAWFWINDWEWFDNESFIKEKKGKGKVKIGPLFPINFIKMKKINTDKKKLTKKQYVKSAIKKFLNFSKR
jgi:hypothetical protein